MNLQRRLQRLETSASRLLEHAAAAARARDTARVFQAEGEARDRYLHAWLQGQVVNGVYVPGVADDERWQADVVVAAFMVFARNLIENPDIETPAGLRDELCAEIGGVP